VLEDRAQHEAADPTKAVDGDTHGHDQRDPYLVSIVAAGVAGAGLEVKSVARRQVPAGAADGRNQRRNGLKRWNNVIPVAAQIRLVEPA
jgi:hypothetical protein